MDDISAKRLQVHPARPDVARLYLAAFEMRKAFALGGITEESQRENIRAAATEFNWTRPFTKPLVFQVDTRENPPEEGFHPAPLETYAHHINYPPLFAENIEPTGPTARLKATDPARLKSTGKPGPAGSAVKLSSEIFTEPSLELFRLLGAYGNRGKAKAKAKAKAAA